MPGIPGPKPLDSPQDPVCWWSLAQVLDRACGRSSKPIMGRNGRSSGGGVIHARGPCGIKELTSYKYVMYGNGQIRE